MQHINRIGLKALPFHGVNHHRRLFFTRKNALLVPFFTIMIVFTMFLDCGLIPRYLNVKSMHLDNSLLALIIPTALTTYNLIILRTAFAGIPPSMEEAAIVDGANRVVTLV